MMRKCTIVQSLLVNLCVLLVIGFSCSNGQTTISKNVICRFWYSDDLSSIDPSICTHLVYLYTYATETNWTIKTSSLGHNHSETWDELQNLNLRLSNPSLKIILHVMDVFAWYEDPITDEMLQAFASHIVDFLRTWNFDGIDWMWRFSVSETLARFIEEVHVAFMAEKIPNGKEPLILMLTVPAWGFATEGVDLHPLGQAVDILHTYSTMWIGDGPNYSATAFEVPMYGNHGVYGSFSESVADLQEAGIPSEKLNMGLSLLVDSYRLLDLEKTGVGAPAEHQNELNYITLCKRLQEEGYTAEFDPEAQVNFAYKGDQWMSYEDLASLEIKMNYVHDHNLGGVVVSVYENDNPDQFCVNRRPHTQLATLYRLAFRNITTTTTPTTTAAQPQTCSSTVVEVLQDPYSCEHYRICVYGQLNRYECPHGLSFDSDKGYCVMNRTTSCVTIPEPCE